MADTHTVPEGASAPDQTCLYLQLEDIAKALNVAKRVVVVLGAGMSTAAGIPDFRSKTGLYARGEIFHEAALLNAESRAELRTRSFLLHQVASRSTPTFAHTSLVAMQNSGRLLRCYTQNIDLLEEKAGLSVGIGDNNAKCVALHGSHRFLRCCLCQRQLSWDVFEACAVSSLDFPCPHCEELCAARVEAGKRRVQVGQLVPDVVRLGQAHHPDGEMIARQSLRDERARPDFLLVLGTSLKVDGPKRLVKRFAKAVQSNGGTFVYVGLDKPRQELRNLFEYCVEWDCNSFFEHLVMRAPGAFLFQQDNNILLKRDTQPGQGTSWSDPIVLD